MELQRYKTRFDTLSCSSYNDKRGPLAQLAEQVTLNHPVGGSSPPRLTLKLSDQLL